MSLTLTALGAYLATRKSNSMEDYVHGIDALGGELDANAKSNGTEVHIHAGTYWTSVAAGLTVLGIAATAGYIYAKVRGRSHDFDGMLGG